MFARPSVWPPSLVARNPCGHFIAYTCLAQNFKESLTSENVASPEEVLLHVYCVAQVELSQPNLVVTRSGARVQVDSIFSNITLIWNFNKTLLAELENQFAIAEESPNLGKVFLDMVPSSPLVTLLLPFRSADHIGMRTTRRRS